MEALKQEMGSGEVESRRNIVLLGSPIMSNIISPLARQLRERTGCNVVLVITSQAQVPVGKHAENWESEFAEVFRWPDDHLPRSEDDIPTFAELFKQAESIEQNDKVKVMEAVMSDRHIGHRFMNTSQFFRGAFAYRSTYKQIVDTALRCHIRSKVLLDKHSPVAVIGYPSTIFATSLINLAEARDIPVVSFWAPRHKNLFSWVTDRWSWIVGLQEAYNKHFEELINTVSDDEVPEQTVVPDAPESSKLLRAGMKNNLAWTWLPKQIFRVTKAGAKDILLGRKNRYGRYLIRDKVVHAFKLWFWRRGLVREAPQMGKLERDAPFIFYPMHIEPEVSLQTECQYAPNQATVIDWLARAVPAGWHVVVKEHPDQHSLRRKGFWELVKRYPNVLVAATLEPAETIVLRARGVAVINGTLGLQAASISKPVITFHEHYIGRLMTHVLYADSLDSTVSAVRRIMCDDLPTMADRDISRRAYDLAFAEFGFPISEKVLLAGRANQEPLEPGEWEVLVNKLIQTIEVTRNGKSS